MAGAITAAAAAVVSAGVGVAGAIQSGKNAANANRIANTQLGMEQQLFSSQGQYRDQLSALLMDPSSVSKLPGFQFQLDTGTEAVKRAFGSMPGGAEGAALMKFGTGLAESNFMDYAKLLASISGLEQNPVGYGQTANAATGNAISGQGQTFDEWSSALRGMAGIAGPVGSAWSQLNPPPSTSNMPTINAGGGYIWNNPAFQGAGPGG